MEEVEKAVVRTALDPVPFAVPFAEPFETARFAILLSIIITRCSNYSDYKVARCQRRRGDQFLGADFHFRVDGREFILERIRHGELAASLSKWRISSIQTLPGGCSE